MEVSEEEAKKIKNKFIFNGIDISDPSHSFTASEWETLGDSNGVSRNVLGLTSRRMDADMEVKNAALARRGSKYPDQEVIDIIMVLMLYTTSISKQKSNNKFNITKKEEVTAVVLAMAHINKGKLGHIDYYGK